MQAQEPTTQGSLVGSIDVGLATSEEAMDVIYMVTILKEMPPRGRTLGWESSLSEAIKIFERDIGALNEDGYYDIGVIEALPRGLFQLTRDKMFFRFDHEKGKWERLSNPPPRWVGSPEAAYCQIG